jgi:hypothetical protein
MCFSQSARDHSVPPEVEFVVPGAEDMSVYGLRPSSKFMKLYDLSDEVSQMQVRSHMNEICHLMEEGRFKLAQKVSSEEESSLFMTMKEAIDVEIRRAQKEAARMEETIAKLQAELEKYQTASSTVKSDMSSTGMSPEELLLFREWIGMAKKKMVSEDDAAAMSTSTSKTRRKKVKEEEAEIEEDGSIEVKVDPITFVPVIEADESATSVLEEAAKRPTRKRTRGKPPPELLEEERRASETMAV